MILNKNTFPINFCTTSNFLNNKKIKFIPIENSLQIKKPKKLEIKNSSSNLSEYQTITKEEITKKDKLINKLKEKIVFLENKIKYLEKDKIKSRNEYLNNTLLLKTEKSNSSKQYITNDNNNIFKQNIPLDKNLLKEKLNKRTKYINELLNFNNICKKNKNNSFCKTGKTKTNLSKNSRNINISLNYKSFSRYHTENNSRGNSALKHKKKTIKLNRIEPFHNFLYCISLNNSKNKNLCSIGQKKTNKIVDIKKHSTPKINAIPKKTRIIQNNSFKLLMSSTNYSNNITNSFKEEISNTKNNNNSTLNNRQNNDNINNNSISFNDIKIKLEKIKNRTKNLLKLYSFINSNKSDNPEDNCKNKEKLNQTNLSHFVKICKLEKIKK